MPFSSSSNPRRLRLHGAGSQLVPLSVFDFVSAFLSHLVYCSRCNSVGIGIRSWFVRQQEAEKEESVILCADAGKEVQRHVMKGGDLVQGEQTTLSIWNMLSKIVKNNFFP